MATTTRRTARKASTTNSELDTRKPVPATEAPAPTKVVRRRRPAAAPKAAADIPVAPAAPKVEVNRIRHTDEYEVDLFADGVEPERDYEYLLTKDASETNEDFVAWVKKYVGYDADVKTVQILIACYKEFQQTPDQKKKTIARRVAAAEKKAAAQLKKSATAAAKAAKEEATK